MSAVLATACYTVVYPGAVGMQEPESEAPGWKEETPRDESIEGAAEGGTGRIAVRRDSK